jgi:hypothetical protein
MFHVKRREPIWILLDHLRSQSGQRNWGVPRGTSLSGVDVLQIASGLSKGEDVGDDSQNWQNWLSHQERVPRGTLAG